MEKEEQKPLGVGEGGVESQCKVDGIDPVLMILMRLYQCKQNKRNTLLQCRTNKQYENKQNENKQIANKDSMKGSLGGEGEQAKKSA